jgi:hypothetical protein
LTAQNLEKTSERNGRSQLPRNRKTLASDLWFASSRPSITRVSSITDVQAKMLGWERPDSEIAENRCGTGSLAHVRVVLSLRKFAGRPQASEMRASSQIRFRRVEYHNAARIKGDQNRPSRALLIQSSSTRLENMLEHGPKPEKRKPLLVGRMVTATASAQKRLGLSRDSGTRFEWENHFEYFPFEDLYLRNACTLTAMYSTNDLPLSLKTCSMVPLSPSSCLRP